MSKRAVDSLHCRSSGHATEEAGCRRGTGKGERGRMPSAFYRPRAATDGSRVLSAEGEPRCHSERLMVCRSRPRKRRAVVETQARASEGGCVCTLQKCQGGVTFGGGGAERGVTASG